MLQEEGCPFQWIEKRSTFEEKIIYSLFDKWQNASYLSHSKDETFTDGKKECKYHERAFISDSLYDKNMHTAIVCKKFNGNYILHQYQDFPRMQQKDDPEEEVLNKTSFMNRIDPSLHEKIDRLIQEFSVDGSSFMKKIIIYGFHNYTKEEIRELFGINKNYVDFVDFYFNFQNSQLNTTYLLKK